MRLLEGKSATRERSDAVMFLWSRAGCSSTRTIHDLQYPFSNSQLGKPSIPSKSFASSYRWDHSRFCLPWRGTMGGSSCWDLSRIQCSQKCGSEIQWVSNVSSAIESDSYLAPSLCLCINRFFEWKVAVASNGEDDTFFRWLKVFTTKPFSSITNWFANSTW